MHVVKGAVVEVLGPRKFTNSSDGVLRLRSEGPLSPQDLAKVEAAANRKVAEDAEILEFEMDKGEAEGHFGKGIYDLAPGSGSSAMLRMTRIPDWEASCCSRNHVETTRSIGVIKVEGATYDPSSKEAELRFHVI